MLHSLNHAAWLNCGKRRQCGLDAGFHRLRLCMFRAGDRKLKRPRERATIDAKQRDALGLPRLLHDYGVRLVNAADKLRQLLQHGREFVEPRMNGCGRLEFHFRRGVIALRRHLALQRFAARVQKILDPHHFGAILVIGAAAKAGSQTHFHFGIYAAGKFWIGMEIFHAAPHLEKVERVIHKLFRRHPRSKRPVVNVVSRNPLSRNPPQPRCNRSAGKFVFHMQLDERREAQPQAIRVSLGKNRSQNLIEDESRFEVGASQRVFDPANAVPQIEPLRPLFRRGKQPLQPPPKVGSLADVRLGVCILAAQEKHGRRSGDGGEDVAVTFRLELDALAEHSPIVDEVRG